MSHYADCLCGRGQYELERYTSCYECFQDRMSHLVVCIICGRHRHGTEYDTCFACRPNAGGRDEAAAALRALILHRDGYSCQACGRQDGLQVDHIVPCAKGGTADEWNLRVLCGDCNRAKGANWHVGCIYEDVRTQLCRWYRLIAPTYFTPENYERFMAEVSAWRRLHTWDPTVHRSDRIGQAS